jgi:hypothetical protein
MAETSQLSTYLKNATFTLCGGVLPGRDQLKTNSVGIHVAWQWATDGVRGPRSNMYVYASGHNCARGSHWEGVRDIVDGAGAQVREYQFLTDIYIERWDRKQAVSRPLLVGEVEAWPSHATGYAYEGKGRNDYLCDFSKLLYVLAPLRLFVACVPFQKMTELEKTLSRGLRDAPSACRSGSELAVILLPTGEEQFENVRVGVAGANGLVFDRSGSLR